MRLCTQYRKLCARCKINKRYTAAAVYIYIARTAVVHDNHMNFITLMTIVID